MESVDYSRRLRPRKKAEHEATGHPPGLMHQARTLMEDAETYTPCSPEITQQEDINDLNILHHAHTT